MPREGVSCFSADPAAAPRTSAVRILSVIFHSPYSVRRQYLLIDFRRRGWILAQSVSDTQCPDMPSAAMKRSQVGLAFDCVSLARVIASLVMNPGVAAWFAIGKAGVCSQLLATRG